MKQPTDLEALTDLSQLARSLCLHFGIGLIVFAGLWLVCETFLWVLPILPALYVPGYVWRMRLRPFWAASRAMASGDYEAAASGFEAFAVKIERSPGLLRGQRWLDFYNDFDYRSMARVNAGVCRMELGQLDAADEHFNGILKENPSNYLALNNLGTTAWKRGDTEKTVQCFGRAIEVNAKYDLARINLGEILLEEGHFEEAEAALEPVAASARDAKYEHLRASALLALGRVEDAKKHCRLGIQFNPDDEQLLDLQRRIECNDGRI